MTPANKKFTETLVEKLNESGIDIHITEQYNCIGVETVSGWYNLDGYNPLGIMREVVKATEYVQ